MSYCCLVAFVGCIGNGQPVLPGSTGKTGEMVVVMEKQYWDTLGGDCIKDVFAEYYYGLPQAEPTFDLVNIPKATFTNIFKTHRNLLLCEISPGSKAGINTSINGWAAPQSIVKISAPDEKAFKDIVKTNHEKLVTFYTQAEKNRTANSCRQQHEKGLRKLLNKKFNVDIFIPQGYKVARDTTDFVWMRYDTKEITLGLLIYAYDYRDANTFSQEYLINMRDSLSRLHVSGPTNGSFMKTFTEYPVSFEETELDEKYAIELKGLWDLKNDFMGGPFVNVTTFDEKQNKVITADGFVYAPGKDKRNYVWQLEAIISTMEIVDSDEAIR